MNCKQILLLAIIFLSGFNLLAQKDTLKEEKKGDTILPMYWHYKQEIGLSAIPLARQFVPFNLSATLLDGPGIIYKKYKNKRAFRVGFGSLIDIDDEASGFIYFSLGSERRKLIYKKWSYTSGGDFVMSINVFGNSTNNLRQTFVGYSKFFGLEYNFNNHLFVSTEAAIQVGLVAVKFVQPTNVRFFYRF